MIDYQPITLQMKADYEQCLAKAGEKGCEYGFANLFLWGRQKLAFINGGVSVFSQFNRQSIYLFPIGQQLKEMVDAIILDASCRGIPCRLTGLSQGDCSLLEDLYPGRFRFHTARDSFDYLYSVEDLAELKGRRFQKKRNHLNRFLQTHPNAVTEQITGENTPEVEKMVENWYSLRLLEDPSQDFHMERAAIKKAFRYRRELELEGLLLRVDGQIAAMTLGSRLSDSTYDIHFEKALDHFDGVYAAINRSFARYIRDSYPEIRLLNREDDMGLEGLRKAKMSYNPTSFREKYWACLMEDGYDY